MTTFTPRVHTVTSLSEYKIYIHVHFEGPVCVFRIIRSIALFFFQTILFVALVNGYWSDWNLWSTCTVTCDGGTRHRERTCIEPEYGGDYCLGESSETEACGTTFCPGIV